MIVQKEIDGIDAKRITGYYDPNDDVIAINVQRVWEKHRCIDKFIKEYCRLYEHELIHRAIFKLYPDNNFSSYSEDFIVRKLIREPFLKKEKSIYEKIKNSNKGRMGKSKNRL